MKQDGIWVPSELALPILALECHAYFTTITNGVISSFVKNYRSEFVHEHLVLCSWVINHVFVLCVSSDVNLCNRIKEENDT